MEVTLKLQNNKLVNISEENLKYLLLQESYEALNVLPSLQDEVLTFSILRDKEHLSRMIEFGKNWIEYQELMVFNDEMIKNLTSSKPRILEPLYKALENAFADKKYSVFINFKRESSSQIKFWS